MKLRIIAVCLIVTAFLVASRNFIVEDGYIYARFIANAVDGKGIVFNASESVNALTSPLFTYLLLGFTWLVHGNVILAEHLLFGIFLLGACIAAEFVIPYSGLAVASTAYFYSLIGLESSLLLLLLMLTAKAYADRRFEWLPLLIVLAMLTRFEAGLLIPILGWRMWTEKSAPRLKAFVPALAIIALYLALNHHWYGTFLPNSATSKFGQAFSGYWGSWPFSFLLIYQWAIKGQAMFLRTIYIVPLVIAFAAIGLWQMRTTRFSQVVVPFTLGLFAFYVLFNIPAYHWYYAPIIFFLMLYAVRGVPANRVSLACMGAILLIAGVTNLFYVAKTGPVWNYVNVGTWINANTPQDATVEAVEIGQVGWSTHRHLIDVLGLTYPKNADHIAHKDVTSWIDEDKPDYIVVHKPLWVFEAVAKSHPEYQEVPFHSGNVYILRRTSPQ